MESLMHVLSQCKAVKKSRTARHNKISQILALEAMKKGWMVQREPSYTLPTGRELRPDLIFSKEDKAVIVDVTVKWESNEENPLKLAYEFKKDKYTPLEPVIKAQNAAIKDVKTHGFPVGTRGLWFAGNSQVLGDLGFSLTRVQRLSKLFARRAVLFSTDHLRNFFNTSYIEEGPGNRP